jgi:hypothetical protein
MKNRIVEVMTKEIAELQYLLVEIRAGNLEAKLDAGKTGDHSDEYLYRSLRRNKAAA